MIVLAVILGFCLCTEEENPTNSNGSASAGEQLLGNWKGNILHSIMYDLEGNMLSKDPIPMIIYYKVTSDELYFYLQIEDSCTSTVGPYTYTTSSGGDTLNYTIILPGMVGMTDWPAQVTIKGDSLIHVHSGSLVDSTGQTVGTLAITATCGTYGNKVPDDSWPMDFCSL